MKEKKKGQEGMKARKDTTMPRRSNRLGVPEVEPAQRTQRNVRKLRRTMTKARILLLNASPKRRSKRRVINLWRNMGKRLVVRGRQRRELLTGLTVHSVFSTGY